MAVKQVTFRVEPEDYVELERRWKAAGFDSLQDAGVHAFRTAFTAKDSDTAEVPAKYRHYLKMLAEILSSGDEPIIRAAVSNVEVFHDRLRPAGKKAR